MAGKRSAPIAPATHVALLRGVNIGRAKRIAMADLRALIEELGYGGVRTLLNSGNAVFSAPGVSPAEAAERIEGAIQRTAGFSARTIVLEVPELAAILAADLLGDVAGDRSRLFVAVLAHPADRARLEPFLARNWAPEALDLGARVAYMVAGPAFLESPVVTAVHGALKDAVTTRTWATMVKLLDLARGR